MARLDSIYFEYVRVKERFCGDNGPIKHLTYTSSILPSIPRCRSAQTNVRRSRITAMRASLGVQLEKREAGCPAGLADRLKSVHD